MADVIEPLKRLVGDHNEFVIGNTEVRRIFEFFPLLNLIQTQAAFGWLLMF